MKRPRLKIDTGKPEQAQTTFFEMLSHEGRQKTLAATPNFPNAELPVKSCTARKTRKMKGKFQPHPPNSSTYRIARFANIPKPLKTRELAPIAEYQEWPSGRDIRRYLGQRAFELNTSDTYLSPQA
jgi:hypothetical protein